MKNNPVRWRDVLSECAAGILIFALIALAIFGPALIDAVRGVSGLGD